MNAAELKGKSAEELQQELNSLLRAQFGLRMQKATQQLTNTSQLSKVRRDIARRAASIWRAVRRTRVVAFRPYWPKLTLLPRVAIPRLRPFCSLRYLRLAGCSILRS